MKTLSLEIEKKTPKNYVLKHERRSLLVPDTYIESENNDGTATIKSENRKEILMML